MAINKRSIKKFTSGVIASLIAFSTFGTNVLNVNAADEQSLHYISNEGLSTGVHYSEESFSNYNNEEGHMLRANHLVIDPSDKTTKIITTKAMDNVNGRETVLDMANREVLKGNNVVAAVNADSYDIDSSCGVSRGIHVQNGYIYQSQPYDTYTTNQPVFYVKKDGKIGIGPLNCAGKIKVGSADETIVPLLNRNDFTWADDTNNTRVFTSDITPDHVLRHCSGYDISIIPQKMSFALIKVNESDFNDKIEAGKAYTGTVEKIYDTDGFNIPSGYIVYGGYNDKADIINGIEIGSDVTYTCNMYTHESYDSTSLDTVGTPDNSTDFAFTSFHLLAKNGEKNQAAMSEGDTNNARTVLGITSDGKIHLFACNKPSSNLSDVYTSGTTFEAITDYMINELGCKDVLNLDGGGSTTMVVKRAGEDKLKTVSYSSDGEDRIVGNSLLFVSTAQKSSKISQIILEPSFNIYKESTHKFNAKITDANGNAVNLDGKTINWTCNKGTIDANGMFAAPSESGTVTVTATVEDVSSSVDVNVLDNIDSLSLSPNGIITLQKDESKEISLVAKDEKGEIINIDSDVATWTCADSSVADVNNGVISAKADNGETDVNVSCLGNDFTLHIIVGMKEQIVEDFESSPVDGYYCGGYMFGGVGGQFGNGDNNDNADKYIGYETDSNKVKNGSTSFRISYNTDNWTDRGWNGTINMYPMWDDTSDYSGKGIWSEEKRAQMEERYTAKAQPKKFGMWLYSSDNDNDGVSDNKDCIVLPFLLQKCTGYNTSNCYDHPVMLNFGYMDWIGWKWVEADLPSDIELPITFNYICISNTNKQSDSYNGTIMYDDIKFIYTDEEVDQNGPEFSDTLPVNDIYTKDTLDFSTVIKDNISGVDPDTIKVYVNDEEYTGTKTYDNVTGKLSFKLSNLADQGTYKIVVKAKDIAGNESTKNVNKTYTVDLQPDTEIPVIKDVTPSQKCTVHIPSPRITFNLTDTKSGIDPETLKVNINNRDITDVYYDADIGWGYAQMDWELSKGSYDVNIIVKDNADNELVYNDTIKVDPVKQPEDPDNFKVDVIPDTQGNTYSERIFNSVAKDDSDIVIHLGDIVDNSYEQEYIDADNYCKSLNKPYFVAAGNHEAFRDSLDYYYQYFGSPTYTFTYGNTRFIFLNSAYGQSVAESDSTQYHYLEEMLKNNTSPNVYVINHVITRDDFNTAHNMSAEEATKFENIMGAYKQLNPDKNVNVIFGHLHNSYTWNNQDVKYIIGGNGAGKGYVLPDEGNILGYGCVTVNNGVADYKYTPLLTSVYIKNDALIGDTLKMFKNSSVQLDLYGDFRESPSNYITSLTDKPLVDIKWESSDPDVVSVDENGRLTAKKIGRANISAVSGNKQNTIAVDVRDVSEADIINIEMTSPETVKQNDDVDLQVTATDVYNSKIVLDNSSVSFTFANNLMKKNQDNIISAIKKGTEEITAEYDGFSSKSQVNITYSDDELKSIDMVLSETITVEDTITPIITGMNYYDVSRSISNKDVEFNVDNTFFKVDENGNLKAMSSGKTSITVNYQGMTIVMNVNIKEKPVEITGNTTGNDTVDTNNNKDDNGKVPNSNQNNIQNPKTSVQENICVIFALIGLFMVVVILKNKKKQYK